MRGRKQVGVSRGACGGGKRGTEGGGGGTGRPLSCPLCWELHLGLSQAPSSHWHPFFWPQSPNCPVPSCLSPLCSGTAWRTQMKSLLFEMLVRDTIKLGGPCSYPSTHCGGYGGRY